MDNGYDANLQAEIERQRAESEDQRRKREAMAQQAPQAGLAPMLNGLAGMAKIGLGGGAQGAAATGMPAAAGSADAAGQPQDKASNPFMAAASFLVQNSGNRDPMKVAGNALGQAFSKMSQSDDGSMPEKGSVADMARTELWNQAGQLVAKHGIGLLKKLF